MERLLSFIAVFLACSAVQATPDLVGRWKSDGERSMQFNSERAKLEDKTARFLSQLMGRMSVTFTKTNVTYEMTDWEYQAEGGERRTVKGFRNTFSYRQLGRTPKSVAVRSRDPVTAEESIIVFHFVDANVFWVYTGRTAESLPTEHLREYFVRQP
jgi:hypothetical protein